MVASKSMSGPDYSDKMEGARMGGEGVGKNRVLDSDVPIASAANSGRRRVACSKFLILGTSLAISLLCVFVLTAGPSPSRDFISENSKLEHGVPVDDVPLWWEDVSASVIPNECHSRNDYLRPHPLFSALAAGCTGVEADVWLADDNETLLVGGDRASLTPDRTLENMYLEPLFRMLEKRNPPEQWDNNTVYDRARGVFPAQPNTTLVLMIDVRTEALQTWHAVLRALERFRQPSKRFLRRYEKVFPEPGFVERQDLWPSALTIMGAGNVEENTIRDCYPDTVPVDPVTGEGGQSVFWLYHDSFTDAPLGLLPEKNRFWESPDGRTKYSDTLYHPSDSYYASTSFRDAFGDVHSGFDEAQMAKLRLQVSTAKKSQLVSRYWDLPTKPVSYRDYVWKTLVEEGVDVLTVDDLESGGARGGCSKGYVPGVIRKACISVSVFLCSSVVLWFILRSIKKRMTPRQDIYLR